MNTIERARADVRRVTLADNAIADEQTAARDAVIAAKRAVSRATSARAWLRRLVGLDEPPAVVALRRALAELAEVDARRDASLAACDAAEDRLAEVDPVAAAVRPRWREAQVQWRAANRARWAARLAGKGN